MVKNKPASIRQRIYNEAIKCKTIIGKNSIKFLSSSKFLIFIYKKQIMKTTNNKNSFLKGLGSILNISGSNTSKKIQRKKSNLTDVEQDWQQVGSVIRDAMNNFKKIIDR